MAGLLDGQLPRLPASLTLLPPLHQVASTKSLLYAAVDLERVAIAGHSRGGKLATLVYCGGSPGGLVRWWVAGV